MTSLYSTDYTGRTPLHIAVDSGDVKILIDAAARLGQDNEGKTPLHIAPTQGHVQICNIPLTASEKRFMPARGCDGRTELHAPTAYRRKGAREVLDEIPKFSDADYVNKGDNRGQTALFYAACSEDASQVSAQAVGRRLQGMPHR